MTADKPLPLTPKLRFPEFRNASSWSTEPLGRLFNERQETGFLELPLLSVTDRDGVIPQEKTNRKNTANPNKAKYLRVAPGDIAYNTMRMWEGRSGRVGMEGVISPAYTVCRPNPNTNSVFFAYYFKTRCLIEQFRKYSQGLVKDTLNLKYEPFSRISVGIPGRAEQQKIADCLGSLDDLIAAEDRKLEALRQHKQGLMQQLFPQPAETTPRLRFPQFRNTPEWKTGRCRDVARVLSGYGFPDKFQGNKKGQYSFYKVSDISCTIEKGQRYISVANNYINSDVLEKIRGKLVPESTIIFAKIGEAIRSNRRVITTSPAVFDNNTAGIKALRPKISDEFLFYLWSNVSLIDHAGGVVPAVSKSAIENVPLCYPSDPEEQRRIADCLGSLDDLIAARARKLEALRQHKKGLMQQLFPSAEDH